MPDAVMTPEQPANLIVQGPRQRSAQWGDLMIALAKAHPHRVKIVSAAGTIDETANRVWKEIAAAFGL